MNKLEELSRVPLFSALDENELESLASRAVERRFDPEENLFWEGDDCEGLFLLTDGAVKILKTSQNGREMMLDMVHAPSSVAELPLFDRGAYPASVRAVKPCTTLFINRNDFYNACRQNPDLALKLLAVVGRRLRQLVYVVESITFGSVTETAGAPAARPRGGATRRGNCAHAPGTRVAVGYRPRGGVAQPGTVPCPGLHQDGRPRDRRREHRRAEDRS